jgi:hypothetical protein
MKKFILILSVFLLLISCDDNDDKVVAVEDLGCLQSLVTDFIENSDSQTPKANIEKYSYKGDEVFVVNFQNFPDGQSTIMSLNCETICMIGGIDGDENDCLDWDDAQFIETIWVDNR